MVAGYRKDAVVGTCRCTCNGQEHKLSQRVGPEQDAILHLHVTARQPQSQRVIGLDNLSGAGDFVL